MTARDAILGHIRERLGSGAGRAQEADARLHERPAGPQPLRAADAGESELVERFSARAQAAAAEVIDARSGLAGALAAHVQPDSGPVVMDADLNPADPDWSAHGFAAACRRAEPGDAIGISRALCGVAETGTLVLHSGAGRPTTALFLPPLHVVVLARSAIVGSYEQAWALVRDQAQMPRTVNWVTGPSRSADIEQTLNLGAHGPVRLLIALVDPSAR